MLGENSQQRSGRNGAHEEKDETKLAMQLADLSRDMENLMAHRGQQPVVGEVQSVYPHQQYNHQTSQDQEWQDHQWGNQDNPSYIEQRMICLEESTERLATQVGHVAENYQRQDNENFPTQSEQANILTIHGSGESRPQEVFKLVTSPDSSDDYMDKLLSIFEDQLKKEEERKEVHEEEDVEENELISLSVDLVLNRLIYFKDGKKSFSERAAIAAISKMQPGHGLKKKYLAREVTAGRNQRSRRKELAEVHRDLGFAEKCPPCCMYELTGNLQDSPRIQISKQQLAGKKNQGRGRFQRVVRNLKPHSHHAKYTIPRSHTIL
ncbi:hypothetical protein Q3G72_028017 [Acer saccharum]|nr:hypothetical protein Q3G72_028017 [Acer saccharum]